MKQIKTVIEPLERLNCFDATVNCLLIDGWELKERKIIYLPSEPTEFFNASLIRYLYAELERNDPPFQEEVTL